MVFALSTVFFLYPYQSGSLFNGGVLSYLVLHIPRVSSCPLDGEAKVKRK